MLFQRRFLLLSILVAAVFAAGTGGYMWLEGWNALDSIWMVAITLTTVGFGEVHPLSPAGRIFTLFILFLGMGVIVTGASMIAEFVVEGQLNDILRRRKMRKKIAGLKGHTIVCGAGRTGMHVIQEMGHMKVPFVVVEADKATVEALRAAGVHVVDGDASNEETLKEAGVGKAARLVTCLTDDRDNLFVVITARAINPGMRIVARYVEDSNAPKFRRAGANEVVSPNAIGGLRMASVALRPAVVTFLDTMLRSKDGGALRVEEATVGKGSRLENRSLKDARISETTGALVVALKRDEDDYLFNPPDSTRLAAGQTVIAMGEVGSIKKLKELAGEK